MKEKCAMQSKMKIFGLVALAAFLAVAPTGAQQNPSSEAGMQEFMKAMTGVLGGGTNAAAAVVDFRDLKALLPAELPGLKRSNAKGEKTGAMGMTVSYAEGRYESGDASIEIKISDNGALGFMGALQTAWTTQEIDSESDTGFERTTAYGSYKAKEQFDSADKSGKVEIMVAGRFMVEVTGNGVGFEAIQAAAKTLDLQKLAAIKPKPAQPAAP
jgi:hypothetical protein